MRLQPWALPLILLLGACEDPKLDQQPEVDAGTLDSGQADVGPSDAAPIDQGFQDQDAAPSPDGAVDGGTADSGALDAGPVDSGPEDTGTTTFGCGLPPPPYQAGEQSCPNCPAAAPPPADFVIQAGAVTQITLNGTVSGAVGDGQFFVVGTATTAGQIFGNVPVDSLGNYSVTVPLFCGTQYVLLVFCNSSGADVITYQVVTTNCTEPELRATIVWDALGDDWELHLIEEGGQINDNATDCTWTSCIPTGPDWGVAGDPADNPAKDVDNTGTYGPENITLGRPAAGRYTVMVEHWGPGDPGSDGYVILNVRGQTYVVDVLDFPPQFVRTAFTVTFPSGLVSTSTALHDCTGNWSGGCRDPIP